ncbi:MAG TPA: hypothetical protein VG096_06720 [Bryobacteraceae bacterium]|nr:hypothetical protein [Bryobacteraceae bacterium]
MPSVASRMKEIFDTTRPGIDPTQVWPLVKVAPVACEREIVHIVSAAVLSGNHVLDVM